MSVAPRLVFCASYILGILAISIAFIVLVVWNDTLTGSSKPVGTTTAPTGYEYVLVERSAAEVWRDWRTSGPVGWPMGMPVLVVLILTVCVAFIAWMYLVEFHRSGSVWASCKRSLRAAGPCVGLVSLITVGLGIVTVIVNHQDCRMWADDSLGIPMPMLAVVASPAYPGCLALVVFWIGCAARGVFVPAPDLYLPPRCEGCGYDLTHVPSSGLCPECGEGTQQSLAPGGRRRGCTWERLPVTINWVMASLEVALCPSRFYRTLKLRTPSRASQRFALPHYLLVALLTGVWILVALLVMDIPLDRVVPTLTLMGIAGAVLVGVVAHRTIAALAVSLWLIQKALPDFAWGRRVVAYESAYLWWVFLCNIVLGTTFLAFDDWITPMFGRTLLYKLVGMSGADAAMLFGNIALGIVWLWRYHLALRAIRWSNA